MKPVNITARLIASRTKLLVFPVVIWWAGLSSTPPCMLAIPPSEEVNPSVVRYERTLDILLPREQYDRRGAEFLLTLRYEPAFEPESQIVIGKRPGGEFAVTYYFLPTRRKSVFYQMNKIVAETGETDPAVIAEQINVQCQKVDIPSPVVAELMSRYSDLRISPELDTRLMLDVTRYRLWFETISSSSQFHFSLDDADYGHDQKAHPLVRWMNEVKRVVEKYAPAE